MSVIIDYKENGQVSKRSERTIREIAKRASDLRRFLDYPFYVYFIQHLMKVQNADINSILESIERTSI